MWQSALVELTKAFSSEQFEQALESWSFIEFNDKQPVLASLFGDIFFADRSGKYWFLSMLDGMFEPSFESRDHCQHVLDTVAGQDEFLLRGLAEAAHRAGKKPAEGEVYSFTPPPILGGPFDVANITCIDFVVAVHLTGQMLDQLRNLPPGTKVSQFRLADDAPASKETKRSLFRG